jgi:hypothetical protein
MSARPLPSRIACATRERCSGPPLEQLLVLPGGSLGHICSLGQTFGRLVQALGNDPDFHPGPEYFNSLESDADYVEYSNFATHDLHHVRNNFNFDSSVELGVLGVSMGQYCAPRFTFIGLASLITSWLSSEVPYNMAAADGALDLPTHPVKGFAGHLEDEGPMMDRKTPLADSGQAEGLQHQQARVATAINPPA